jgi:hypothetical protein
MPKKMILIFIKYLLEIFFSLSHHIAKKRRGGIHPPLFSNHPIPHCQKNNSLEKKKPPHLPTLKNNQTSPSHAIQETTPRINSP